MKIDKIDLDSVRYNPEFGAFETLVRISDRGQTYSYPAQVAAPLHAEMEEILRSLSREAARAHRAGRRVQGPATRMRHVKEPMPQMGDAPPKSFLGRILGHRAA